MGTKKADKPSLETIPFSFRHIILNSFFFQVARKPLIEPIVRLYLIKHGRVSVDPDMEGFLDVDTHQMPLEEPDINIAVAWTHDAAMGGRRRLEKHFVSWGIYMGISSHSVTGKFGGLL